jgi:hypothetical protein
MWCPLCGKDYHDTVDRCPDCAMQLVDRPDDMPKRAFVDLSVRGRRYEKTATALFDEVRSALGRLGLDETNVDQTRLHVGAAKRRRRLGARLEVLVVIKPESDSVCIVETWIQQGESWLTAFSNGRGAWGGGEIFPTNNEPPWLLSPDGVLNQLQV